MELALVFVLGLFTGASAGAFLFALVAMSGQQDEQ